MFKCVFAVPLFSFLGLLSFYSSAQTIRIDSLKKNISLLSSPTEKLKGLIAFCNEWESIKPDTLKKYALLTKATATALKDNNAVSQSDYYLAAYLFQKDKLDDALPAIDSVIANMEKTKSYSNTYVQCYFLRGNILLRTLHYDEVLKQDLSMLSIAEQHNDTVSMIRFGTGIGNVNLRLKKYDEALNWHYKAVSLMNTDKLKATCSFVYINIAVVYYHLAEIEYSKSKEDSIEMNLQKAIEYARLEGGSLTNLANGLGMYGNILAEYKKPEPAKAAFTEAIEIRKKIGDIFYIITDMTALATLYKNNNQSSKAIALCLEALALTKQTQGDASLMNQIYTSLGDIYANAGDYKNYSELLTKKIALLDSTYKVNSAEAIAEIETKYDVQKKENIILQQKYSIIKGRYLIYTITGLFLLLGVIFFLVLKNRRRRQQVRIKELVKENEIKTRQAIEGAKEEERKRIIADLHDDVGGGLSTIRMVSDLIADQGEQTIKLNEYAHKISGITKDVTERMNTIVWALNTENDTLQSLSEYIRQNGFKFFENSSIEFTCEVEKNIGNVYLSSLQRKNIFLTVKEALNNIYKHAQAKKAVVQIMFTGKTLTIIIQDDGKGIKKDSNPGNGLKNMRKRMKEINGSVTFSNDQGARVVLQFSVSDAFRPKKF